MYLVRAPSSDQAILTSLSETSSIFTPPPPPPLPKKPYALPKLPQTLNPKP